MLAAAEVPHVLADNVVPEIGVFAPARVAVTLALRRDAGRRRVVFGPTRQVIERSGKDLREVDLLVGSGGVLRHNGPEAAGLARRIGSGIHGTVGSGH